MHQNLSGEEMILDNLVTRVTSVAKSMEGLKVTEQKNVVKVNSGVPSDTFNVIIPLSNDTEDSLKELSYAIQSFQTKAFPVSIWVDQRFITNSLLNMLKEVGFEEAERNVTMKLDRLNDHQPFEVSKKEVEIRQVQSIEDLLMYSDVLQSLFGATPEANAIDAYFKKIAPEFNYEQNDIKMYIGISENRVVSTGIIVEAGKSYGIYDIATREDVRGKGFGSTMFQYLLKQLATPVIKPCVLQASPDGINIYKRAGFQEVGEIIVFEKNR
ncbi:GNAT family N-acetyltransferase [Jeotgalibacillus marinus]|uniref:GNAT family N-acetyltransferase n=1 Tax=Jeotgalibacillus marinus TaxID=86667 RepID=A0ABV3Q505_9BACL